MVIRSAPLKWFGGGGGTRSYTARQTLSRLTIFNPAGQGYCRYSTTHRRPRSSKLRKTGWEISGSARTCSHSRSSATWKCAIASLGLRAGALVSCGKSRVGAGGAVGADARAGAATGAGAGAEAGAEAGAGAAAGAVGGGLGVFVDAAAISNAAGGTGSWRHHRMPLSNRRRKAGSLKSSSFPSEV